MVSNSIKTDAEIFTIPATFAPQHVTFQAYIDTFGSQFPALGRVELGNNETRWVAQATAQLDYWVTTGASNAEIMEHYADVTGHAPEFPACASGFWQSKLRYQTQDELLNVAREYKRRGLPPSVIVIDFFHWTLQGDWRFDPVAWPDPTAMVQELEEMGVKVLVSVWRLSIH